MIARETNRRLHGVAPCPSTENLERATATSGCVRRRGSCRCGASRSSTRTRPRSSGASIDQYRIEVPVFETPHGWVLRVSVQGYNDEDDLQALENCLAGL